MVLSSLLPKCKLNKLHFKALDTEIFRSSMKFVTGNSDGSVSLFNGAKLIKTKKLDGRMVHVGYFNGQIVAVVKKGNLTVLNESLGIIKEFPGTKHQVRSLCGNAAYLAFCDENGSIRYYNRNSEAEAKVIFLNYEHFNSSDLHA